MPDIVFPGGQPVPIRKQPDGNYAWVATDDALTQFGMAKKLFGFDMFGAHSYKAGKAISNLKIGDEIEYRHNADNSDANLYFNPKKLKVVAVRKMQVMDKKNEISPLMDLDSGERYDKPNDMMRSLTKSQNGVILQTCLEKNGDKSWGRVFVVAE